jgi:hypothetical protein
MQGHSTTPPMAIIKDERQQTIQAERLTSSIPPLSLGPTRLSSITPSTSNSPNPQPTFSPDIEIPPRFRPILENVIRINPNLIEHRYNEFLAFETQIANTPLPASDQIRL